MKMVNHLQVIGFVVKGMVKVSIYILMDLYLMVHGKMIVLMAMVLVIIQMVIVLKDNG